MSNLRLLKTTEITSSVSSVQITDVFTDDFSIYKITTNDMTSVSSNPALDLRYINSSSSVISSSSYDRANLTQKAETSFSENRNQNATSIASGLNNATTNGGGCVSYIFNPFSNSSFTFHIMQGSSKETNYRSRKMISVLKNVASITGIDITFNGANCTSGTIKIYGLRADT
tara:strand:- start:204 stop:719 length:516 start_codon:yes stop_codon:yes gene_type:complete